LSEWCNLTPAMRCYAVNTAAVTLLPYNQFYRGLQGERSHRGGVFGSVNRGIATDRTNKPQQTMQ